MTLTCLGFLFSPPACAATPAEPARAGSPDIAAPSTPDDQPPPAETPQEVQAADETEQETTAPPPEQPPAAAGLTPDQARDLAFFRQILMNPANDPASLTEAAARLLAMSLPPAIEALNEALAGGQEPIVAAVLSALSDAPRPAPELRPACINALRTAPPATRDALGRVLVRYGEDALNDVARLAEDQEAAVSDRLGAVHALGAFRSPSGAARLIGLLDPQRNESAQVVRESCLSLQRLSGSPFGNEAERWRQWWSEVRDLPPDGWNDMIVRNLAARIAELELAAETERAQRLEVMRRLGAVYSDLFPVLTIEDQFARLPAMLDDELETVRQFAITRIGRLLRDSVRIPPDVRQKLAERLAADPSPNIRLQAVRLLDQQNHEGLSNLLAERLDQETDREVVAVILGVLARRPLTEATGSITRWLGDPELGKAAADALWACPELISLTPERRRSLLDSLHALSDSARTAAHERLLAAIGDDTDLTRLEDLLDGDDQDVRLAVAEGFTRRGHRQPLLDRADDPLIRPFVLRVLAEGAADLASFQRLVSLRPAGEDHRAWDAAVQRLGGRLTVNDLLEADAILAGLDRAPQALRVNVLLPVAETPPQDASIEQRTTLLLRLSPLLMMADRARKAHELLLQLNGAPDSPELLRARFRAAALSIQYDQAAQLSAEPAAWVSTLTWIVEFHPPSARRLRDEIARRFAEQLTGDLRTGFDAACAKLPEEPPAETPPPAADSVPPRNDDSGSPSDPAESDDPGAPG
ncbi:MAG: hypothetical protein JSV91_09405 [Phycisphaerales bacterium]|nr:MAG: hypothetical protein JSV91_09405 [Phycisphaerales bacterium]